MRKLKSAIAFLTIIPIKSNISCEKEFTEIVKFFPIVALILGIIYYIISGFAYILSDNIFFASIIYVISSIIFTGGLHYDGLADSIDGLLSCKDRQKTLEIMSDSRIGTFGVLSIVINILFKIAIIYLFFEYDILFLSIISVIFSRTMQVIYAYSSTYAKKEGMGNFFISKIDKKSLYFALFTSLFFLCVFSFLYDFYLIFLTVIISYFILIGIKKSIEKKLGGITGDILGLVAEISENIYMYIFFVSFKLFTF